MPSRRRFLATVGAAAPALGGCLSLPDDGADRPTASPRSPEAVPATGTWPQRGGGPGHAGATDAAGVPGEGRAYWQLRRVRSGPAVLADGRLFHYAKLGEDADGPPTLTRTREPDAGTAHPIYGVPHLVARDASDGSVAWAAELPAASTGWPAVAGDRVVATADGTVFAFDPADGTQRWSVDLGDHHLGEPTVAGDVVLLPRPGVVDGASGDTVVEPRVHALALADGAERWQVTPPTRGLGVAAADGTVVVAAHDYDGDGTLTARSLADGSEQWRRSLSGDFVVGPPVVAGGRVHVPVDGSGLHVRSLADGSELWHVEGLTGDVAATEEAVYAVERSRLHALDAADGTERWTFAEDGESYVTPAVGDGTVYVGGDFAALHALDAADGTERWNTSFPNQVVEGDMVRSGLAAQPAVADGALYAFAADGLYAFGPDG